MLFITVLHITYNLEFFRVLLKAVIMSETSLESGKGIYGFKKYIPPFLQEQWTRVWEQGQKIQRWGNGDREGDEQLDKVRAGRRGVALKHRSVSRMALCALRALHSPPPLLPLSWEKLLAARCLLRPRVSTRFRVPSLGLFPNVEPQDQHFSSTYNDSHPQGIQ